MAGLPISVFIGAKGGAGTTTLCLELARAMREKHSVALVDADLSGNRSVAVLCEAVRSLDAERDGNTIASVRTDGITIFELADRYDAAFTLDEASVESCVGELGGFDAIVVDAPRPFGATVRPFITRAQRFFIVLEPTLLGVAGAQSMMADLKRFGVPPGRIDLITNTRSEPAPVQRSEIERALDGKVVAEIPLATGRSYAKSIVALQRYIESIPNEGELPSLQPSAGRRASPGTNGHATPLSTVADVRRDAFKQEVHAALLRQLDLVTASTAHGDAAKLAELRSKIESIAASMVGERKFEGSAEELAELRQEIVDEALGLGPLEDLMRDPDITEIMINGPSMIYVERFGKIERTTKRFTSDRQLRLIIERIITPLGRRIDESSPMVDARLPDGSRVNAIIEPIAIDGTSMTIRRFGVKRMAAEDLVKVGAVPPAMLDFLRAAVQARLNCVVSGGTGSGKTTFLNVLSSFLPDRERIVTIEDAAELRLNQSHVVRLESRPPNIEGTGEIRIRDLFRNALRMRPDRVVIGECRGAEALDMLQAMNTGHDGSLTTIHANSQRDAISRIETLVMMAGYDLPVRAIREQISAALDLVVHTSRLRDGARKLIGVSEVVGMESDVVTMQEIMRFAQHGVDAEGKVIGEFVYTGVQPMCIKRFEEYGIPYDPRGLSEMKQLTSW
ncbi:MAG TPA: ATPase, T2SS/T4P/T4SS family [Candidatus Cybelea sp.]|nr:ATPase, T2SS/T4P/T4SS family [Candidatus Cybelea sp.]